MKLFWVIIAIAVCLFYFEHVVNFSYVSVFNLYSKDKHKNLDIISESKSPAEIVFLPSGSYHFSSRGGGGGNRGSTKNN